MRMSCNGCRVLRKGCSEGCSIRPCLQWIKNPESQANATVFLAKFYGRAGLLNLINAGPDHLRPDIFRSLLYEACGRIVNPIYGSVGLLWSGSWQLCQSAVESVLRGSPIVSIPSETAAASPAPPILGYDIRHVSKESGGGGGGDFAAELHKAGKCRTRFKRSGADLKARARASRIAAAAAAAAAAASPESERRCCHAAPAWSHESAGSRPENESMFSAETVEASHVSQGEPNHSEEGEVGLELTLGFETTSHRVDNGNLPDQRWCHKSFPAVEEEYGVDLHLELAV